MAKVSNAYLAMNILSFFLLSNVHAQNNTDAGISSQDVGGTECVTDHFNHQVCRNDQVVIENNPFWGLYELIPALVRSIEPNGNIELTAINGNRLFTSNIHTHAPSTYGVKRHIRERHNIPSRTDVLVGDNVWFFIEQRAWDLRNSYQRGIVTQIYEFPVGDAYGISWSGGNYISRDVYYISHSSH